MGNNELMAMIIIRRNKNDFKVRFGTQRRHRRPKCQLRVIHGPDELQSSLAIDMNAIGLLLQLILLQKI